MWKLRLGRGATPNPTKAGRNHFWEEQTPEPCLRDHGKSEQLARQSKEGRLDKNMSGTRGSMGEAHGLETVHRTEWTDDSLVALVRWKRPGEVEMRLKGLHCYAEELEFIPVGHGD